MPAAAQLACTPGRGRDLGPGEPGGGRRQPGGRPGRRAGHRAGARRRAGRPGVGPGRPAARHRCAAWCVAWIVAVARRGAGLPGGRGRRGGPGPLALVLLTALVVVVAAGRRRYLLRRPATGARLLRAARGGLLVRPPTPGWPPDGWVLAACDVGQGDALVLHAGPARRGRRRRRTRPGRGRRLPRPARGRRRCRWWCSPTSTPTTSTGCPGSSTAGRSGAIETTRLLDPPEGVRRGRRPRRGRRARRRAPAPYAVTRRSATSPLQVLWPPPDSPTAGPGDGSTANEASVVLLAEVRGVRILLTGDVEPEGQAALAAALPGLRVDVLKVPHHGSRYQDEDWLLSLGARVALVSVGADNDYGHPAAETLDAARGGRRRGCCAPTSDGDLRGRRATTVELQHGDALSTGRSSVGALWQACRTMAGPSQPRAADVLGRVTLVTGKEEFLNERTVAAVRDGRAPATTPRPSSPRPSASDLILADARRAGRAVALLQHPLRGGARPGEPPRGVRRRACSPTPRPRPTTSRWCWCTAAARRAAAR